MTFRFRGLPMIVGVLAASGTVFGPVARGAATMARIASIEGISEYRLPNGLQVLLCPDPSDPNLTVTMTFKVGSRYEGYGETGMAHILEHLMFKGGTPSHPNIYKDLSIRGSASTATTSYDYTMYSEELPATERNLRWALELEADRMVHTLI